MVFLCSGGKLTNPPTSNSNENGVFKSNMLSLSQFSDFWRRMCSSFHDEASQFIHVVIKAANITNASGQDNLNISSSRTPGLNTSRNYFVPEDLVTLIQDVVDSHPGLGFLKEATEFHSRYVHTVSFLFIFFSAAFDVKRLDIA